MSSKKHLKKAEQALSQAKASISRLDKGSIRSFRRLQVAVRGMDKGASDTEATRRVLADIWKLHIGLKNAKLHTASNALYRLLEDEHRLEEIRAHARELEKQDKEAIAKEKAA